MFRAICKFTQFQNCTVQIEIAELRCQVCAISKITQPNLRNFKIAQPSLRDFKIVLHKYEIVKLRSAISKVDVYSNTKQTRTFP